MKTDANIRLDVENELRWEPSLDEKGILVKVEDGVVSLEGSVPHFSDRWSAEEVTKRVVGVRAIANDIEVKIPKPGERSDAEIAAAAANALKWHFSLESSDIKAVVKQGWVTLSGQVLYGYQKSIAEVAVRYLMGVKDVVNDIEVCPAVKARPPLMPKTSRSAWAIRPSFSREACTPGERKMTPELQPGLSRV
jgi:osmotically-inducible protein OsmY